ncbi:hypothetical protein KUTeg_008297 [Tegillarca granosa]|uniref:Uncharacterized protein n=1 Tax=Tegillarca granosa TaxID=220873 RepID=A0ABQ9FBY8_TEGGR|nr:hypothetical protein KUTeg_008297 [Tegillarca granosa]
MENSVHCEMIAACQCGDQERVMSLLQLDCSQLTLDSSLCWASRCGNLNIASLLLNAGANSNAVVWGGFSPLIWAAIFSPDVSIISFLIGAGSDVNHSSTQRRQTALHAAVIRGNIQVVSILLEAGAEPDLQDYLGKTPLMHAVQRDFLACAKLLMRYNCDVNIAGSVNGTIMSPLILALIQNNLEMTKILILAGAKFQRLAHYQTYTVSQYYHTVENDLNFEVRPLFLQQQCRVCIRHLLKPHFLQKLRETNNLTQQSRNWCLRSTIQKSRNRCSNLTIHPSCNRCSNLSKHPSSERCSSLTIQPSCNRYSSLTTQPSRNRCSCLTTQPSHNRCSSLTIQQSRNWCSSLTIQPICDRCSNLTTHPSSNRCSNLTTHPSINSVVLYNSVFCENFIDHDRWRFNTVLVRKIKIQGNDDAKMK